MVAKSSERDANTLSRFYGRRPFARSTNRCGSDPPLNVSSEQCTEIEQLRKNDNERLRISMRQLYRQQVHDAG